MQVTRPTLLEINTRTLSDIRTRIEGATPILRRGVLGVLAAVFSAALHALYGFVLAIARQCNPATATGDDLGQWASLWIGQRLAATVATGPVELTGTPGEEIPALTRLQSESGVEYETSADVTLDGSGLATVTVTALAAGAAGNQPADAVLSFVSPIESVDSEATVASGGLLGGRDIETDDELRARLIDRLSNPPVGGTQADYERWAKTAPNVDRAWCFPLYSGAGTVRVFIADDSYVGATTAAAGAVTTAQGIVDALKPVTATVTVAALDLLPVGMDILAGPDNPAVRLAITESLRDLFYREAAPEAGIPLSRIREAISIARGEYDHTLSDPVTAPTAGAGQILALGTITWL